MVDLGLVEGVGVKAGAAGLAGHPVGEALACAQALERGLVAPGPAAVFGRAGAAPGQAAGHRRPWPGDHLVQLDAVYPLVAEVVHIAEHVAGPGQAVRQPGCRVVLAADVAEQQRAEPP